MKIRLLSGFGKWIMAGGYCYCLVAGLVACTPDRGASQCDSPSE
ncbi:hypothetical protein NXV15_22700 [Bacteroides thetaiotaomicron]|nr:hypothetical protein [Bacteroides thetaiotaomicron]MCS2687177.1 hypothetical protein [Bacteroides thetaiotaomicron]